MIMTVLEAQIEQLEVVEEQLLWYNGTTTHSRQQSRFDSRQFCSAESQGF